MFVTRTVVAGIVLSLAGSLAAAQDVDVNARQAADAARADRGQVRIFEAVLARAIQNGGMQLAARAREVVPDVELAMLGAPVINAVSIPGVGLFFDVQVPDIQGTSLLLFDMLTRERAPTMAVNNRGVAATALVEADPMVTDPDFDPNREYGVFVRDALIEAMLGANLPLHAGDRLIVSARVPAEVEVNPLSPEPPRRLVLQILTEDLDAYRMRQIDLETAKDRIIESRD